LNGTKVKKILQKKSCCKKKPYLCAVKF
jgi:hypothetical protein